MTIDSFVWFVLFFAATIPVAAVTGQLETTATSANASLEGTPATVAFGLWLALGIGYHTVLEWQYGQTVGKYLVGITVRNDDGSRLSLRSSIVRNVARLVDFLPIYYVVGIIVLLFSNENKRLGDRWGKSVVVRL